MMTLSDQSGQVPATCFDDAVSKDLEEASREGGCGLLTVELDRRAGEDSARVTVRRIKPLEDLAATAKMILTLTIDDPAALPVLAKLLETAIDGRGEIHARAALPGGGQAELVLGRTFRLDHELSVAIGHVAGVRDVSLAAAPALALAG